jgi:fructoselysine-6-P-deglycase FrlB-like protein
VRTLAITSTVGQPLEQIATSTLPLLPSDEESTVMTRSFTSMVLGLQYLSAFLADDHTFCKSLSALPALADTAPGSFAPTNPGISQRAAVRRLRLPGARPFLRLGLRNCA